MAYMKYLENKKEFLIYEDRHGINKNYKLGEMLFSFLELDFSKYDSLYKFCSERDFTSDTLNKLNKTFPKTTKELLNIYGTIDFDESKDYFLEFLFCNKDYFSDLYAHPYLYFSDTIIEGSAGSFETEYYDADFYELQKSIKELIEFCFLDIDNPKLNDLSPIERYYLFTATKHARYKYILNLHTTALFLPMSLYNDIQQKYVLYSHSDVSLNNISNDLIEKVKGHAKAILVNKCETVQDFCYLELYTLLSYNVKIKRCTNCGRLFIPSGKHNTDCCDRIPNGEKYSCKKIMAQKRRKEKIDSSPIIKEFERAYKRNYARVTNRKMSSEDFRLWVEEATKKRDVLSIEYSNSPSEEILLNFKKYLGNK